MAGQANVLDALGLEAILSIVAGESRTRDRAHAEVTWRASGDPDKKDVRILTGYPAVFGQKYTLYESDNYKITEEVAPGFFDPVLADDCHLNIGHDRNTAMCRNSPCMPEDKRGGPGSMDLSVDAHGLRVHAQVPMDDLDAQRLAPKMDHGVMDQMSYAFTVAEEDRLETREEGTGRYLVHYTLKKARSLMDVCVCPLGANSQTEVALRTFASQLAGRSQEGLAGELGRSTPEGPAAEEGRSTPEGPTAKERRAALYDEAVTALQQFTPRTEE
jgi:hypothetical protein